MSIQKEIDRTKAEIAELRRQIGRKNQHGRSLALRQLGVDIGDRIMVTKRVGGIASRETIEVEAQVTGLSHWESQPRLEAVKIRKDGTVSTQSVGYIDQWRKKGAETA